MTSSNSSRTPVSPRPDGVSFNFNKRIRFYVYRDRREVGSRGKNETGSRVFISIFYIIDYEYCANKSSTYQGQVRIRRL